MFALIHAEPFSTVVKGSRFLGELLGAADHAAAKAVIAAQRLRYPDATHVVHALALGPTAAILGCSDDGEPAGTAGRPVLEVLKGAALTDAVLTVTRWFGGTKLGTGGLVKAYTECAKGVIASAQLREIVAMRQFQFLLPFPILEKGKRCFAETGFILTGENYNAQGCFCSGTIPASAEAAFCQRLRDISKGAVDLTSGVDGEAEN